MDDEGYQDARWWAAGGFAEFSEPEAWEEQLPCPSRPVVGVSWYEATAFCVWANVRLPTEAQWERAARGTTGRKYPWGDEPADEKRLNYARDDFSPNVGHSTPVGIYALGNTPEGISDMAGNVWEWCENGYEAYTAEAVSNPSGSEEAPSRVNRGGSWRSVAGRCRSAYRLRVEPEYRYDYLGFRVAAVPPRAQNETETTS